MQDFKPKDDLLNDLISFLKEKTRSYEISIDENTSIEDGLGVTGDDGAGLIADFSIQYNVDISNFEFEKYFNDEPNLFMQERNIIPLTIKDLVDAITIGKLE